MATVESLFGMDADAYDLAKRNLASTEDANFGSLMPAGYGAVGAGFSKLARNTIGEGGIFGSKDPVLQKKAKLGEIFKAAQAKGGTELEILKEVQKGLAADGGFPKELMTVAGLVSTQEATASQAAIDNSIKTIALKNTIDSSRSQASQKVHNIVDKVAKRFEKHNENDPNWLSAIAGSFELKPEEKAYFNIDYNNSLEEGGSGARALYSMIETMVTSKIEDEDGYAISPVYTSISNAVKDAIPILRQSVVSQGAFWFEDELNYSKMDRLLTETLREKKLKLAKIKGLDVDLSVTSRKNTYDLRTEDGSKLKTSKERQADLNEEYNRLLKQINN
jgi:hypothetical protein